MKLKNITIILFSIAIILSTVGFALADIEDNFNRADDVTIGTATNGNTWIEGDGDDAGKLQYQLLNDTTTAATHSRLQLSTSTPTRLDWQMYWGGTTNAAFYATGPNGDVNPSSTNSAFFISSNSGFLRYYVGSWQDLTSPLGLVTGTWYNISLRNIDYTNHQYDIYVNGVLRKENAGFTSNQNSIPYVDFDNRNTYGMIDCIVTDGTEVDEDCEIPTTPETTLNNFSTVSTNSFSFNTPVSIGSAWGTVNSVTGASVNGSVPYYFSSVVTTNATVSSSASCRISIDGSPVQTETRTLSAGTLGNLKIITSPVNLSVGNHTVTTECRKTSGANYEITNSVLVSTHLNDDLAGTPIPYIAFDNTGYSFTSLELLDSFTVTTSNTTNTTNTPNIVVNGRASYVYGSTGNITTYLVNQETGSVCGNYTRYGTAGSVGSVGTTCLFEDLNSSTTYNLSFYASSSVGTGGIDNLKMNVYEILLNDTAKNSVPLSYSVPNGTETVIASINISNHLGGTFNVFVDAGIMVQGNTSEDAYFYINNTESSVPYYRTLGTAGYGNINALNVYSESGTGNHSYDLVAYCPSGCEVEAGDFSAFVTDADTASTGLFNINAYNVYNDSDILVFNASIGGTTYTTSNGTITALSQGTPTVTVTAQNFFTNTTVHDSTTDLNASMSKYTYIQANFYGGSSVTNFTVNSSSLTLNTTTGGLYFPVTSVNTSLTINGDTISVTTELVNKTQYYNFTVYEENSLLITFKDSVTDNVINNVSIDYFSSLDSANTTTTNGSVYLTLLNPVAYTFRVSSAGYDNNLYFTTIVDDTYEAFTIYLNPNGSTTAITIEIVDGGASPVESATVQALKYYVSDNTYRVVASGVTNPDGETVLGLVTGDNFYKFNVLVDNTVVKATSPFIITGSTLRIQVLLEEEVLANYNEWYSITSSLSFNTVTNNWRFEYIDGNSVNREVCMSVYKQGFTTDTLINNTCVSGVSGTILSGIDNTTTGTYYAVAKTTINGEEWTLGKEYYTFPLTNFGTSTLIGQVFLTLIMSLSGFIAIELLFLLAPLSLIIGGLVGLHSISLGVTIPLFIMGLILMFMLRRNN